MPPLAETNRIIRQQEAEAPPKDPWDSLMVESDALLAALERCNLREQPKLSVKQAKRVNAFLKRYLAALPETLREASPLVGVVCGHTTSIESAMDRVYLAQEVLFELRKPRWAYLGLDLTDDAAERSDTADGGSEPELGTT